MACSRQPQAHTSNARASSTRPSRSFPTPTKARSVTLRLGWGGDHRYHLSSSVYCHRYCPGLIGTPRPTFLPFPVSQRQFPSGQDLMLRLFSLQRSNLYFCHYSRSARAGSAAACGCPKAHQARSSSRVPLQAHDLPLCALFQLEAGVGYGNKLRCDCPGR